MFTGLSAFPLTPVGADAVDDDRLHELVARLDRAGVDSIGVLGSTGSYAYLTRDQRRRVAEIAVRAAGAAARPGLAAVDRYGSLRVVSAIAEHAGLVGSPNLPRPVTGLPADAHRRVSQVVEHPEPDVRR